MTKREMQKAIENTLMYYATHGRADSDVEERSESQFNLVMADLVRAFE